VQKPLGLKKIKLPLSTLWAMSDGRRSALLLLGLFLNEANWLRKLLVKALKGLPSELVNRPLTPEEEASLFEESCRLEQASALMGRAREFLKKQRVLAPAESCAAASGAACSKSSNSTPWPRDVPYGRRGRINARELWEQMNTCSCLNLILACIVY
jgi:hypothetical protein